MFTIAIVQVFLDVELSMGFFPQLLFFQHLGSPISIEPTIVVLCLTCVVSHFSIITQVIIEILALSLAENGVIFRYNHLRGGDYSGRTNFQNNHLALCQCV